MGESDARAGEAKVQEKAGNQDAKQGDGEDAERDAREGAPATSGKLPGAQEPIGLRNSDQEQREEKNRRAEQTWGKQRAITSRPKNEF
jgi:hypothetical protein